MKLQELEQKYEELGREIEKLKNQKKGKRWKPDCGEEYYFIGLFGGVCEFSWNNCPQDNYLYSQGNCFQTEGSPHSSHSCFDSSMVIISTPLLSF
jgi:hypothetical protein